MVVCSKGHHAALALVRLRWPLGEAKTNSLLMIYNVAGHVP